MMRSTRSSGLAIAATFTVLASISACGNGGGLGGSNGEAIYDYEVTTLATWQSSEGFGECSFIYGAEIYRSSNEVFQRGNIACKNTASTPHTCAFQVELYEDGLFFQPLSRNPGPCEMPPPIAESRQSCFNASCAGEWDAEAGIRIEGPTGATWTAESSSCLVYSDGGGIVCDIRYPVVSR